MTHPGRWAAGALVALAALPVLFMVVIIGAVAGLSGSASRGPTSPTGSLNGAPTIMGVSRLSADQLTAYLAKAGQATATSVDTATLMALYIDTGAAYGVRADLAVAQAVVETGAFTAFPGNAGGRNNYAGITVYDGQSTGSGFTTAADGVTAHIALLREFADASFHGAPVHAAKPGCCPTWPQLAGTWATDPSYWRSIKGRYDAMLASAGLPPDPTVVGPSGPVTIDASGAAGVALSFALAQQGKPYVWGAQGPDSFDCSGLTLTAYRTAGITIPRVAADQFRASPKVPADQLQPGDLVFYAYNPADPATIHHVVMYVGNGQMVNAPHTGDVVRVGPLRTGGDYAGAVRPSAGVAL